MPWLEDMSLCKFGEKTQHWSVTHTAARRVLLWRFRRAAPLLSLGLIEPTEVNLLRRAGEFALYEQIDAVCEAYFRAFESGEEEAARRVIDLHDGDGSFDALPPRVRDYIVATTRTNILDWRSGMSMDEPLLFTLPLPCQASSFAADGGTRTQQGAPGYCGALRDASLSTVRGAAHSMMATHGGGGQMPGGAHLAGGCTEQRRPNKLPIGWRCPLARAGCWAFSMFASWGAIPPVSHFMNTELYQYVMTVFGAT